MTRDARTAADAARNTAMGAGVVDDPYPLLHRLRAECPVAHGAIPERFGMRSAVPAPDAGEFAVLGIEEGRRVLREERFSSRWYEPIVGQTIGQSMLSMDPPEHQRHRFLLQPAFSQRTMERWEHDIVRPVVAGYLDGLVARGRRADLYEEFAAHVPIHVMAQALGLSPDDEELFVDWAVTMTSFVEPVERRVGASRAMEDYIGPMVIQRRARPDDHDDLLTTLVRAQVPNDADADDVRREPLSDEELATFVRLLVVAGASTVYRGFGLLLFALFAHPDQLAAVRADHALIPQAIEEALRWEQPVASIGRICTAATMLGDVQVPAGAAVVVELGAANRDATVWAEPDRFDIFRPAEPHLGFGLGRHLCLGIHLARMELRVMLEAVLDTLANVRPDPDAGSVRVTGLQFRMVTGLPVVWDS